MKVKVDKEKLLEVLKSNMQKHKEIVEEALVKYREMAVAELDQALADARAGKRIWRRLTLIEPVDQTREYQKAIRQVQMSAEETITLEDREFECLILDQWSWKAQFLLANSGYSAKATQDSDD